MNFKSIPLFAILLSAGITASAETDWFIGAQGGANAFIGSPRLHGTFDKKLDYSYRGYAGTWITPHAGLRASYQGGEYKNCCGQKRQYKAANIDVMYNLIGNGADWTIIPYIGGGIMKSDYVDYYPFALDYGIIGQYSINAHWKVNIELSNTRTFNHFDGRGSKSSFGGDNMLSLSAGISYHFGKVGKKIDVIAVADNRSMDVGTTSYTEESPVDASTSLSEETSEVADTIIVTQIVEKTVEKALPYYIFYGKGESAIPANVKYNLKISVDQALDSGKTIRLTASADSATGSPEINERICMSRINNVKLELLKLNFPGERIETEILGGVEILPSPEENRNVRIQIISK